MVYFSIVVVILGLVGWWIVTTVIDNFDLIVQVMSWTVGISLLVWWALAFSGSGNKKKGKEIRGSNQNHEAERKDEYKTERQRIFEERIIRIKESITQLSGNDHAEECSREAYSLAKSFSKKKNGGFNDAAIMLFESFLLDTKASLIVGQHIEVLQRKYKELVTVDEYGVVDDVRWIPEVKYFAENVLQPAVQDFYYSGDVYFFAEDYSRSEYVYDLVFDIEHWKRHVSRLVKVDTSHLSIDANRRLSSPFIGSFDDNMSWEDYERYVAQALEHHGFECIMTPRTADHGADIVATLGRMKVAIQCKKHETPIGNSSVQQAYSAKGYYDCTHAAVVTNSIYTPHAKRAADRLGVHLLHHRDLPNLMDKA